MSILSPHSLLGLIVLLVAVGGCERDDSPQSNVLLISIDTLRPDHLGCYGAEPSPSPSIDAFCRESIVFEEAIAQAPSTLPSHASMFTSLLPRHHRALFSTKQPLALEHLTVAEVLSEAGYRTASFNDGGQVGKVWQLDQGFGLYESIDQDRFAPVVDRTLDWLDTVLREREKFFLFLHTFEVHHPYTPAEADLEAIEERRGLPRYSGRLGREVEVRQLERINRGRIELRASDQKFIETAYDAEIFSMDRAFARLRSGLEARGLWKDTLVVFTSDHGEEFGEHGRVGWHSHTLYDELLRVPLVVKLARAQEEGSIRQRVGAQVRLIDVAPTVLDALGLPPPASFSGHSLLPLAAGENLSTSYAVAELDGPGEKPPAAIRTERWKLYEEHLFDLEQDPGETFDVADSHPELVQELTAELERLTAGDPVAESEPIEFDRSTRQRLRALGYL